MKTVVIVPGFTESRVHFKRLIITLKAENIQTVVVMPWKQKKLDSYQGHAVYVAHSMGTYYVALGRYRPALLVGVIQPEIARGHYFKAMHGVARHAVGRNDFWYHLKLRAMNVVNFFRYFIWYVPTGLRTLTDGGVEYNSREDIIIVRNKHDVLSTMQDFHYYEDGHHDDILYHPGPYIEHIKRLFKFTKQ